MNEHRDSKPNLLFIYADQMRGQAMGCAGNSQVRTPHLDRLASQGVMFTNDIANCPVCTPNRGTLLTGRYPLSHKAVANDVPLLPDDASWGNVLRDAGYRTGYIGEWRGVRTRRYTYARWQDGSGWVLYDNEEAPYQLHDLIYDPKSVSLKEKLEEELQRHLDHIGDRLLPWQKHIKELNLQEVWHRREEYMHPKNPRLLD